MMLKLIQGSHSSKPVPFASSSLFYPKSSLISCFNRRNIYVSGFPLHVSQRNHAAMESQLSAINKGIRCIKITDGLHVHQLLQMQRLSRYSSTADVSSTISCTSSPSRMQSNVMGRINQPTATESYFSSLVESCETEQIPSSPSYSSDDISRSNSNRIPFLLADIGEGIAEVELLQWFIAPGDHIRQFDKVCEVQSDKATVEITSRYDGIVDDLCGYQVGDVLKVGHPLLFIRPEGTVKVMDAKIHTSIDHPTRNEMDSEHPIGVSNTLKDEAKKSLDVALHHGIALHNMDIRADQLKIPLDNTPKRQSSTTNPYTSANSGSTPHDDSYRTTINISSMDASMPRLNYTLNHEHQSNDERPNDDENWVAHGKVLTTPAVRKLCKENNIDLLSVVATGPHGRIMKGDVLKIIEQRNQPTSIPKPMMKTPIHSTSTPVTSDEQRSMKDNETRPFSNMHMIEDQVIPLRGYHRLMATAMQAALQVPHMCYADEVNVTELRKFREELKSISQEKGIKLSYLPFAIKACSLAMKEFPVINSSIDLKNMTSIYHANHNIGIAIDSPRGLVVPVIEKCQNRSILDIAQELNRLHSKALEGSLSESDLVTPTFTVSNIGALGGTYMNPVVLPPQVAIGALGKIQRVPRFVGTTNQIEEAYLLNISWGGDHRALDGATLARFSNLWKSYMEMPAKMTIVMM